MYYDHSVPSREEQILSAATEVLATRGAHGLTHRAVDQAAGLAQGSTSNLYRTREALVTAVAEEVARRRLEGGPSAGSPESLAWLELLLLAKRDSAVAAALEPVRARMLAMLDAALPPGLPLTTAQLAAFLTGIEYATAVTDVHLDSEALLEELRRGAAH